jgi:hypothetical protein
MGHYLSCSGGVPYTQFGLPSREAPIYLVGKTKTGVVIRLVVSCHLSYTPVWMFSTASLARQGFIPVAPRVHGGRKIECANSEGVLS